VGGGINMSVVLETNNLKKGEETRKEAGQVNKIKV
jgi:hypothetical protein